MSVTEIPFTGCFVYSQSRMWVGNGHGKPLPVFLYKADVQSRESDADVQAANALSTLAIRPRIQE